MADQYFEMTQKNYEDLKKELDYLVKEKRPEIIERIAEARSHGDLSENAEYDAAREEQRSNEGKIAELEYQIKNAVIIAEVSDNTYVHLDSKVTVEDVEFGDKETYTITSVTVVDNSETLSIASGALEQIPEAIVAANSPDVDVVAGATYTSNGIMNAVKDAIGAAE